MRAFKARRKRIDMSIKASEISDLIKARIDKFSQATEARNVGTVVSVTDGIVRVHGLADARYGEMIEFDGNTFGLALNLEQDSVGAVVLGDYKHISEGSSVKTTGRILEVPVGPELLGRVVDALGNPIDGKGPVNAKLKSPLERVAPGVIFRKSVSQPVQTGLKAIDSMVPIGRGQRELIIGDRQTGKTAVAIDTIINQKGTGVKCVYVAIGQKQSSIANVVRKLEEHGAMGHTVIVAASASTPAAMQYLAPYGGCAMGEYFMDNGEDALIVYDDLSKQAVAYRQISLLLRRPPGREAYPGDVFYLHSRLLERSARVNEEYVEKFTQGRVKGKTGSLTGIPIIETQAGDVTAFVPTNVISITDGQIFLETDLFNAGMRPAINAGISVSRVGGAAQTNIIKKLGGGIRLALAQYRELAAFSQFASDLDEATRRQLERGQRVTELMKQKQYAPMSVAEMALSLYAANNGFFDKVDRLKVVEAEAALQSFARSSYADLLKSINAKPDLSADVDAAFKKCCTEFFATL
jgi:F-type H+-transporting ATPase subunit alpha